MRSSEFTGKSLGILLTVHPSHPEFSMGVDLASEALQCGQEVYLYCLDEAILGVPDKDLQALRARGLRLFACAYGARKQGMPCNDQAVFCGLSILCDLLSGTDQCAVFDGRSRSLPLNSFSSARIWLMVIIESDPMQNGRPVEALRVAAGLCVWQKMDIVLCLNGKGLLLMDWEELQFEGFQHCLEYFKILADHSVAIYTIQKEHDSLLFSMKPPVKSIPLTEWSQLSVQAGCVLRF